MELRHLRYFLTVAEEGSFTKAAEKLLIAQPPLSRQIRDLEEELNTRLFVRKARGLTLTESGEALKEKALCVPEGIAREFNLTPEEAMSLYQILYKMIDEEKARNQKPQ